MTAKKTKILMLCDHPLSTSGVGTQARHLIDGLLKTGKYSFRVLGAAVKHERYDTIKVDGNDDYIIKPIDGFGNRDMIRISLMQEKPDAIFIFTDPRFFIWLWEMEEEVHQICPIVYWHVWDEQPYPVFNEVLYHSTDLINCHSYLTYEMVKARFPEKTNFIPHAVPKNMYYTLKDDVARAFKRQLLGENRLDHFVCIWANRNAKRKRPNDVLLSWKLFLDLLEKKHGHRNATLLMHTDPHDIEGSNLIVTNELLKTSDNVVFSKDRVSFEQMNVLYNISDTCLTISMNEGFGLGTLEAMQTGRPIIAVKTGGLTRQVVDHRDGTENGIALPVELSTLVGSQLVPYIYERMVSCETTAEALLKMYDMGPVERKKLGLKAQAYAHSEFDLTNTVKAWDDTMSTVIDKWKNDRQSIYKSWSCKTL